MALILNQRVRFRGALCQVVAVTPAAGNTTYKLKHVATDKVLDGDFIHDDELEVVDPEDARKEEDELRKKRMAKIVDKFGDQPTSDGDLRDKMMAALHEDDPELPVPEARQPLYSGPRPPLAPGREDKLEKSVIHSGVEDQMDYSSPDGTVNPEVPQTLQPGEGLNGLDPNPAPEVPTDENGEPVEIVTE